MKIRIEDIKLNTIEKVKKFVNITNTFKFDVYILQGRYVISGKSIMGIFSLNLTEPLILEADSEGEDDREINRFNKEIESFCI